MQPHRGLRPVRLSFAAALACGLLALAAPGSPAPPLASVDPPPDTTIVYVVGHGWHTGLVVPRGAVPADVWPAQRGLLDRFPQATYLEIAWGDSAYYTHPDPGLRDLMRAALRPTSGVLHLTAWRRSPAEVLAPDAMLSLTLTDSQLAALGRFVQGAYVPDAHGRIVPLGPGLGPRSLFYRARGRYHLFYTCNTWIVQALAAAGVPIRAGGVITQEDVFERLRPLAAP